MSSSFLRSVLTMMKGTAMAQAIPLLLAPLLTRLYSPADYGLFVLFVAVAGVLVVVATLRYELAIVVAASEAEAAQVARLALVLLGGSAALIAIAGSLFGGPLAALAGRPGEAGWVLALAPMVALLGAFQVASYAATRSRDFGRLARGLVVQQAVFGAAAVALGALARWPAGLIAARIGGVAAGVAVLWPRGGVATGPRPRLGEVASRYRQFALYNCPYSLVGTLGRELFLLAVMAAGQAAAAGHFGLARSVVYAPVTFLSASLSQVFYREAASTLGTPAFGDTVLRLTRSIARLAAPPFAAVPLLAPGAFAWVFGEPWREAGHFAALLAPVGFLFLFSSWPERVFEVAGRQRVSFAIQLGFDLAAAIVLFLLVRAGYGPLPMLVAFVAIGCAYHLSYLAAAARVAALAPGGFLRVAAETAALGACGALAAALARSLAADVRIALGLFAVALVAYYGALLPALRRDLAGAGTGA
jgi:O-antigen/teichoic acid export membrane protein